MLKSLAIIFSKCTCAFNSDCCETIEECDIDNHIKKRHKTCMHCMGKAGARGSVKNSPPDTPLDKSFEKNK